MLAVIAGSGRLPREILKATPALVCGYHGSDPEDVTVDYRFRIETLGSLFAELKRRGVAQVCFAGGIDRPVIDQAAIDAETQPLVPDIAAALSKGDDGALRRIAGLFETRGMQVVPAHAYAPHLLPEAGSLTNLVPTDDDRTDIARAKRILDALSDLDLGQSCAVLNGQALAIEGQFGTEWMLRSLQKRPDDGGGVLVKAPKKGQDIRFDMPVIGHDTVEQVKAAGLNGIAIEAGGVMVLDLEDVVAACNAQALFLEVCPPTARG